MHCPIQPFLEYCAEFTGGTLAAVVPLDTSNILFLLGGGPSPLYSPNKVIVWDDALGREVAELEFNVDVKGIACRRGWLAVALRRRVAVFQIGEDINRYGEWDTYDNPKGTPNIIDLILSPHIWSAGDHYCHMVSCSCHCHFRDNFLFAG